MANIDSTTTSSRTEQRARYTQARAAELAALTPDLRAELDTLLAAGRIADALALLNESGVCNV